MKYFILILLIFLNGCLYVNERGVSTYLYDKCDEYYDANGTYHSDCDEVASSKVIGGIKDVSSSVIDSTKSLIGLKEDTSVKTSKTSTQKNRVKVVKKRKCKIVCKKKTKCKCKKKRKCADKN